MTQTFEIRTIDLPSFVNQLHRQSIGVDRMFNELQQTFANSRDNYPPHNVINLDDTHYLIEVAVAGFTDKEIEVELKENILTVKGEKDKSDKEVEYQYKGISTRSFIRSFPLAEHIEVRGATVKNGILVIALEKVIPEEKKPKKIPISFSESSTLELKAD